MLQYNPSISGSLSVTGSLIVTNGMIGTISGVDVQVFSSSINQVISGIQSSTGSSDAKFETLSGVTSSALTRLTNIESKSASVDISVSNINSFTASNGNTSLNQLTGSLATTGSNTFFGTQTFSGSVYIANNLVVQGSSSIQYISASSVSIGTNIVQLNTANPSVRFAGLTMIDSGSVGGSGSFLYDSLQDEFIFVHRGNGTNITSSHFVLGPETYDNLGNETYLSCNIISKGTGKEHLVDSTIFDDGTTVCVNATLKANGQVCSLMGNFGCVGIGTSTPLGVLDLAVSSGPTSLNIINSGSQYGNVVFKESGAGKAYLQYVSPTFGTIARQNSLEFGTNCSSTFISFRPNDNEAMRISGVGYLGIGATNPIYNLHVCCSNNGAYIAVETGACTAAVEASFIQKTPDGLAIMALGASPARGLGDAVRCDWAFNLRTGGCIRFSAQAAANNTHFLLAPNGVACFASTVCSPIGLFSGCVGIGSSATSPRVLLDIRPANNTGQVLLIGEGGTTRTGFGLDSGTAGMRIFTTYQNQQMVDIGGIASDGSTWTRNHRFGIAGGNSFLNECGGYVGITTNSFPSFATSSNILKIGSQAIFGYFGSGANGETWFINNAYYDGFSWKGINTASAQIIKLNDNNDIRIFNDASVTAATNFTPTERMRIASTGLVTVNSMIYAQGGCFASKADARALYLKQNTVNTDNIIQFIDHTNTFAWEVVGRNNVFYIYNAAIGALAMCMVPANNNVHFPGSISKGSGTFNIEHPLESKKCTHRLIHSFIEGPQADLIYRGKINLESGIACVNIDCVARMTEGTFQALNRCTQVFTTNESSWSAIKGKLYGNILVIESQNTESNDEISWMVIGERQDKHIKDTSITDTLGRIITETEVDEPFTCTQ